MARSGAGGTVGASGTGANAVDRSRLPTPARAPNVQFPPVQKSTLTSGLRIWTVAHLNVPVVTLVLLLPRGSAADPAGKEGLAALTLDMLDEGSGGRTAIEVHEALARIGAQLDSDISADAMLLTLTALSRFTEPAVSLLADLVARPALADEDFSRVRQLRLHRLMQLRDLPGAVADRTFLRLLYGTHPYGHTPLGNEPSLAAMSVDDVRRFHAGVVRPGDAVLVAVGDCDHAAIAQLASVAFAGWQGEGGAPHLADGPLPAPSRLNIVARAGAPQSELRIGHVAVARDTPDYHALVAANMVLGGQFVSRININLREDKGLTYGARTAFDFRRLPGPFSLQASVQTSATAQAIEESVGEIAAIRGARPVTPVELALGVAALTRGYARNFETSEQVARAVTQMVLYNLPDDYFTAFVPLIEQVTADDVTRVAAAHLDPSRLTTLVVGDVDRVAADLGRLGMGELVVLPAESF
jgi:predicted Zn-dependent peptidase